MSVGNEALRARVLARARQQCEYCHVPTKGQVATFPIDHVTPQTEGGATSFENLALACPCCNGHKWKHRVGIDPLDGKEHPLFNPRVDVWEGHFEWSAEQRGFLVGKTAIGRATIDRLQMNAPEMVVLRELLGALGLFPEVVGSALGDRASPPE